jgi:hypothetical protein
VFRIKQQLNGLATVQEPREAVKGELKEIDDLVIQLLSHTAMRASRAQRSALSKEWWE